MLHTICHVDGNDQSHPRAFAHKSSWSNTKKKKNGKCTNGASQRLTVGKDKVIIWLTFLKQSHCQPGSVVRSHSWFTHPRFWDLCLMIE